MKRRMQLWLACLVCIAVAGSLLVLWSHRHASLTHPLTTMPAARPSAAAAAAGSAQLRARRLAPDQQCVAGTVVTVRANYAMQMVRDGRIVHCKGRLADMPIR